MNLREQFEQETGKSAYKPRLRTDSRLTAEYAQWLEERLKRAEAILIDELNELKENTCDSCGDLDNAIWKECGCHVEGINEGLTIAISKLQKLFESGAGEESDRPFTEVDDKIGYWLSAALSDDNVCEEFKEDIRNWFNQFPDTTPHSQNT